MFQRQKDTGKQKKRIGKITIRLNKKETRGFGKDRTYFKRVSQTRICSYVTLLSTISPDVFFYKTRFCDGADLQYESTAVSIEIGTRGFYSFAFVNASIQRQHFAYNTKIKIAGYVSSRIFPTFVDVLLGPKSMACSTLRPLSAQVNRIVCRFRPCCGAIKRPRDSLTYNV